jgi:hypothetical protein
MACNDRDKAVLAVQDLFVSPKMIRVGPRRSPRPIERDGTYISGGDRILRPSKSNFPTGKRSLDPNWTASIRFPLKLAQVDYLSQ